MTVDTVIHCDSRYVIQTAVITCDTLQRNSKVTPAEERSQITRTSLCTYFVNAIVTFLVLVLYSMSY